MQNREKLRDLAFVNESIAGILKAMRRFERSNQPAYYQRMGQKALDELAVAVAHEGQASAALALMDSTYLSTLEPFRAMFATPVKIRIGEQAMLTNNQEARPALDAFLTEYLLRTQAGVAPSEYDAGKQTATDTGTKVAASVLAVCFWRPFIAANEPDAISQLAPSLTYQLNNQPLGIGLNAPFKAYGLADKVYQANEEMNKSPFQRGFTRLRYINQILLGYAHLKTSAPADGRQEHDEAELTSPADYQWL